MDPMSIYERIEAELEKKRKLSLKAELKTDKKSEELIQNSSKQSWELTTELLRWTSCKEDSWSLEEALRGTQIFGATGSGKTTGSGRKISQSFLKAGFGGLVLCVKQDDASFWKELCKETGRESDFLRVSLDSNQSFNFLEAEAKVSHSALTLNISEIFSEILQVINRSANPTQKDPFWHDAALRMINHAIVLQLALENKITIRGIYDLIQSSIEVEKNPSVGESKNRSTVTYSTAKNRFLEAEKLTSKSIEVQDAIRFFQTEFQELAEKTRSIVISTFTSMADSLFRPPLSQLFCEKTTCTPEETFAGKILVIDIPVHQFHQVGRISNLIWKTAFKRSCQRRISPKRPVFLWCDESQYLMDSIDMKFQTTARSMKCCTVLLTQSIQNYYAEFQNKDSVKALLGSLHNKIYHQNGDIETNEFASESIGKVLMTVKTVSKNKSFFSTKYYPKTITESEQWEYDVQKRSFSNLKIGGLSNHWIVDGIVSIPGKKFSNNKPWIKTAFFQNDSHLKYTYIKKAKGILSNIAHFTFKTLKNPYQKREKSYSDF